jgi:hypothetical protein
VPRKASKIFFPAHLLVLKNLVARQSEQHDAGIQRLWDELNDLREQKKQLYIQEDNVLSRLYEALGYMAKTSKSRPSKSHKTLRWANNVDDHDPDEDIRRSNKRARNSSQAWNMRM